MSTAPPGDRLVIITRRSDHRPDRQTAQVTLNPPPGEMRGRYTRQTS